MRSTRPKAKADVAKAEAAKKATEVKNDAKEALRENAES